MPRILALSGSLRSKSFNTMLLHAVVDVAPAGTTIDVGSIKDIPLYNADLDAASGPPPAVRELKEQIASTDGLLLVSPEYNHSIPGVFKNAIDWASRPVTDIGRVFDGCPVGVIGATTGQGGTNLGQEAWIPVLRGLRMLPFFGAHVGITNAGRVFDEHGTVVDPTMRTLVEKYIARFAEFSSRHKRQQA